MVGRTDRPLARAGAHLSAGRIAEAEGAYNAVLSLDPNEVRAHLGLADCALRGGRLDEAVDHLSTEARALADRGETQSAFMLLTKALAIAPDRMELHIDVADVESCAGRTELAAQRLENLSRAYAAAGAHEDAALVLEAAQAFRNAPAAVESASTPRTTMTGHAVGFEEPEELEFAAEASPVWSAPVVAKPPAVGKPPAVPRKSAKSPTIRTPKRNVPPIPTPSAKPAAKRAAPPSSAKVSKPASKPSASPKRSRKRSASAAPRWRPPTASNRVVPKAEAFGEEAPTKKSLEIKPAPRPRVPAKPISRSITPAPSPKRGGKKLSKLPAVGEGGVAALLRRPPLPSRGGEFLEDETTAMWRRRS